jgi:hypothetical protein
MNSAQVQSRPIFRSDPRPIDPAAAPKPRVKSAASVVSITQARRATEPDGTTGPVSTTVTDPTAPEKPSSAALFTPNPLMSELQASPAARLQVLIFALIATAALVTGYMLRHEGHLSAESGTGYLLGIIGSLLMLVLLIYPLRKKARFMRNWGQLSHWFRFHMLAGVIGPILILFHANFQLGSLNSKVVLGSTLLVAGSGLFGRYLYTKIHYGLYGKKISLEQLHDAISQNRDNLSIVFTYAPRIQQRLLAFDKAVLNPTTGVFDSIGRVLSIDLRRRWAHLVIRLALRRSLKVAARRNNWTWTETNRQRRAANKLITRHFNAVLKVAEFSFYERFFSLWHVFHLPLFLLMIIALAIHVIAVHMY